MARLTQTERDTSLDFFSVAESDYSERKKGWAETARRGAQKPVKDRKPEPADGHAHQWLHLHGTFWCCQVCKEFEYFPVEFTDATKFTALIYKLGWKGAYNTWMRLNPNIKKHLEKLNSNTTSSG